MNRNFGQSLGTGKKFSQMSQGVGACRNGVSGSCQGSQATPSNPQNGGDSQGDRAGGGWGTGTTPFAVQPTPGQAGHQNYDWNDPNATPNGNREYKPIYAPSFEQSKDYDVQLEGKFTDSGGTYTFTEKVDPDTGEVSYVPHFSIEPTDVESLMDAIEDQDIPRSYADLVRLYFEQLAGGSNTASSEPEATTDDGVVSEGETVSE